MKVVSLHDRLRIETFLRRDPGLHLYALGDLDDFFWPSTVWFGLENDEGALAEIALLYIGARPPVLLLFCEDGSASAPLLLREIAPMLPSELYAHLTPSLVGTAEASFRRVSHGEHLRMIWRDRRAVEAVDVAEVVRLGPADRADLDRLYLESYPGNWFDPRMLETGRTFGIRREGRIVSVAGLHVFSATQRVAALGNVTTHPEFRRRGFGTAVCARLCLDLAAACETIGLNVKADNATAIQSYERLGFETVARYEEQELERLPELDRLRDARAPARD